MNFHIDAIIFLVINSAHQYNKVVFIMRPIENELIEVIYETALETFLWPIALDGVLDELKNPADFKECRPLCLTKNSEPFKLLELTEQEPVLVNGDRTQQSFYSFLKPHLNRAVKIRLKHNQLHNKMILNEGLLDRMPIGVLVIDKRRKIYFQNTLAIQILQDEKFLMNKNGVISPTIVGGYKEFTSKLDSVYQSEANNHLETFRVPDANGEYLSMLIAKYSGFNIALENQEMSLLFIVPPNTSRKLPYTLLKKCFNFTRGETKVANLILQGNSLKTIADYLGISIYTVRAHLRSLFLKTDTNRQSELMCRLLTAPAITLPLHIKKKPKTHLQTTATRTDRTITLHDGRRLGYSEYGDTNGKPLVFCHCIYGCRLSEPRYVKLLKQKGIRYIIPDRPGVGLSDPKKMTSYTEWAADLEQLADHLNLRTFSIEGINIGGNYALAAAWKLAARIDQVTIVSPSPPVTSLPDARQFITSNRFLIVLSHVLPRVARGVFTAVLRGANINPYRFFREFVTAGLDENLIRENPYLYDIFCMCLPELVRHGSQGLPRELILYTKPLDFDISSIEHKVTIFRGQDDQHIPENIAEPFMSSIPSARIHCIKNHGHSLNYTYWEAILQHHCDHIIAND